MGGSFREKFGNDEIYGAVFGGDLLGNTANSDRFEIFLGFDDGDEKVFNPPKEVLTVDLAGATGELELSFAAVLIESQLAETDGLTKLYQEFGKGYREAVKEEMAKRELTPERAKEVAQPGYLTPRTDDGTTRGPRFRPDNPLGGSASMGTSSAGTVTVADEDDLMDPYGDDDGKKKEEESHAVRDGLLIALATACITFGFKYGEAGLGMLVGWSKDKFFPPAAIKAKVDASATPDTPPPSAAGTAEFVGHNGMYEMDWEIVLN